MAFPYTYQWQKYRIKFLEENRLCVKCPAKATIVDHITPHKGNMNLFWCHENHQPLCKRCHDSKTASVDGGLGNKKGKAKVSSACDINGNPIDNQHHWNK